MTTAPEWRERSAKALATLTLTQRATPFLYQGDELGMTNYPFQSIDEYDDVEAKGLWRTLVETGEVPAEEFLSHLAAYQPGPLTHPDAMDRRAPCAASAPTGPGWR